MLPEKATEWKFITASAFKWEVRWYSHHRIDPPTVVCRRRISRVPDRRRRGLIAHRRIFEANIKFYKGSLVIVAEFGMLIC